MMKYLRASLLLLVLATVLLSGCAAPMTYDRIMPADSMRHTLASEAQNLKGDISMEEAVIVALKNDPDLGVLRGQLEIVEAQKDAAMQIRDPELRLRYGQDSDFDRSTETIAGTNAPWFNSVRYSPTFLPVPGWVSTGANGVWVNGDVPPSYRSTDPTTQTYIDTRNGQIVTADQIPDTYKKENTDQGDGSSFSVTLRLFPPNPFTYQHRRSSAETRILQTKATIRWQEWLLAARARMLCEDILYLEQEIIFLEELTATYERSRKSVSELVSRGYATIVDQMRETQRFLESESDRDRAKRRYNEARTELAELTGTIPFAVNVVKTGREMPKINVQRLASADLEAVALRNRDDITALIWQTQAASASLEEARSEDIPWFSYVDLAWGNSSGHSERDPSVSWSGSDGSYQSLPLSSYSVDSGDGDSWSITAGMTLPLFSGLTDDDAVFRAEYRRSQAELSARWRGALSRIRVALARAKSSATDLDNYRMKSVPEMIRMEALLENKPMRKSLDPADIRRIEESIIELKMLGSELEYDYRRRLISLTQAVGRDLEFLKQIKTSKPAQQPVAQPITVARPVKQPAAEPVPVAEPVENDSEWLDDLERRLMGPIE